jgi:TonB family protein
MALTQIPSLQEPPPQVPPQRELDFYDSAHWESAYREMHDFPTLLIQAQDDLARARKREALWMSLFVHSILVVLILLAPKFEKYFPHRVVMRVNSAANKQKDLTFLTAPPDIQKTKPPQTNQLSDKNRIAQTKQPKLDRDQLKKILDASKAGRPGPTAPPEPKPTPPQQAAQSAAPQPQAQPEQQQQQPPPQVAKLQTPPMAKKPPPSFTTNGMSAGRAIEEAAKAAAESHNRYTGDAGDLGLGQRQSNARMGPLEITTDTQGVDFGPYLQRVLHVVKQNWYANIPESAMPPILKKGKVTIDFAITKTGQVAGMRYVFGSGDVALDRAAYGGITASNPFPPLPNEFTGQYLGLRFTFYYNPDKSEADLQ